MNNSLLNRIKTHKTINTISIVIISFIIIIILIKIFIPSNNNSNTKNDTFILIGSDVTINYKGEYIEQGCKYIDKDNNDLSDKVEIINNVNTKVPGKYKVIYRYNNKIISRTVTVLDPDSYELEITYTLSTKEYTNKDITVTYKVNGKTFQKVEEPSGNINNENEGSFTISKNGTYIIKAYTDQNQTYEKVININNIITDKPEGNCTLTINDNGGEIIVTVENEDIIKGYQYYYGSNKTTILASNKYQTKTKDNKATVTIYDKAGNFNNITCTTINNTSTPTPKPTKTPKPTATPKQTKKPITSYKTRSYREFTYNGVSYMLYSPSNSINGKIPLVVYYHGAAGLTIGLPLQLSQGLNLPYYIICPINNTNTNFAPSLISYLRSSLKIDTKRIYIAGASSGTKPALNTAYQHKGLFAGAIIISSYADTPRVNVGVPMWFFQGSSDNFSMVASLVNNINSSGGKAKLTTYQGGHNAPLGAFTRDDLNNWILKK